MSLQDLTDDDVMALRDVAAELGAKTEDLAQLVHFESAGTWDPQISNPTSSAKGLIQFMNATARAMGYASSAALVAAHPTVASQLRGPVLAYLKPMAPFPNLQSLAMAVFYPAARRWPESREFPENVQAANPGIRTVGDYVSRVRSRAGNVAGLLMRLVTSGATSLSLAPPLMLAGGAGFVLVLLLALALGLWALLRRR